MIAILGASGCVGRALIQRLLKDTSYRLNASYLGASELPPLRDERVTWSSIDIFDISNTLQFLRGAEILIYLVHSLGSRDFKWRDPALAYVTAEAARQMSISKIIYLGGIIPEGEMLSAHLESRKKTGQALASAGIPVAEVRASIILGSCSISYQIIYHLSKKLPIMVVPSALNALCAPIALEDAVSALVALIERPIRGHEIFEIGAQNMRYRDLLGLSGARIITLPWVSLRSASRFIHRISGIPLHTLMALVESLKNNTHTTKNRLEELTAKTPQPIESVLKNLLELK